MTCGARRTSRRLPFGHSPSASSLRARVGNCPKLSQFDEPCGRDTTELKGWQDNPRPFANLGASRSCWSVITMALSCASRPGSSRPRFWQ